VYFERHLSISSEKGFPVTRSPRLDLPLAQEPPYLRSFVFAIRFVSIIAVQKQHGGGETLPRRPVSTQTASSCYNCGRFFIWVASSGCKVAMERIDFDD